MKTLCKDGISIYLFDDAVVLVQSELGTDVGDPVAYRIGDCRSTDSTIHEGVTAPQDWEGGKYAFDGTDWAIANPEIIIAEKAEIWEQIKAIRDTKKLEGGYTTGGKWFHSDVFSRTQQLGLVMMGAGVPPGLLWKTMDGSFVTMTQVLAGQIFSAAASQDSALFTHAETLKAQVDASPNPSSIDLSLGWPETYETSIL